MKSRSLLNEWVQRQKLTTAAAILAPRRADPKAMAQYPGILSCYALASGQRPRHNRQQSCAGRRERPWRGTHTCAAKAIRDARIMQMRRLVILVMAMGMVAAPSLGASYWAKGTATFEHPVRSDKAILGGESVWLCEGTTCRGRAPVDVRSAGRYCRELARWGGPVVSFEAGTIAFDADALRRCNGTK